jgi:uncharacterized protein (DUF427 family)
VATASFRGIVIAESDDIEMVEGNPYFPVSSLRRDLLVESSHHTRCSWKGTAGYWTIDVAGARAENAAWYYPEPMAGAEMVPGRVAFYRHLVDIELDPGPEPKPEPEPRPGRRPEVDPATGGACDRA